MDLENRIKKTGGLSKLEFYIETKAAIISSIIFKGKSTRFFITHIMDVRI